MQWYLHRILGQLYARLDACLIWHDTLPSGRTSHSRCLHLYTRLSPAPGKRAHVIPVFEAMFTGYLIDVSDEEAQQIDPGLVADVREMCAEIKHLTHLQRAFPLTAQLCFVDVARTPEGILYDVYRKSALFETRKSLGRFHRAHPPMQYLTMLLHQTGVLPTRLFEGRPRVLVPYQPEWRSDLLLAEALTARIWGAWDEVPTFPFEVMVI